MIGRMVFGLGLLFFCLMGTGQDTHAGKPVYDKYCSQCHGEKGDGKGYATDYVLPKPRDFTTGVFKFRNTGNEFLPTQADLKRVVVDGIHGTSMPSFSQIGEKEIDDVVEYIMTFFEERIERDRADGYWPPKEIEQSAPPSINQALVDKGKAVYLQNGCGDCHGRDGRADGPSGPTLKDDYDVPIRPANLSQKWRFRGGGEINDIYRAFSTGLSGTPMPSYMDSVTEDDRWALSAYVHQLSPSVAPNSSSQIVARKIEGELPGDEDDPRWEESEEAYFPLSAQVIWEPINIDPTVLGVKVKALHNDQALALMLKWDDPTFSRPGLEPATASAEESDDDFWDDEEEEETESDDDFWGEEEEESTESVTLTSDAFAVQFPAGEARGNEKPYFVMGNSKYGVNLWKWNNDESVTEVPFEGADDDPWKKYHHEFTGEASLISQIAKGHDDVAAAEGEALSGRIHYDHGTYTLIIHRNLVSANLDETQIVPGQFMPISFWAWDGHNLEEGIKASLGSWTYLVLEQPMARGANMKIAIAILITLAFQFWAVKAARKPKSEEDDSE